MPASILEPPPTPATLVAVATPGMIARAREARAARLRSLPVRAMSVWEDMPDVRATTSALLVGNFGMPAMLADELFADDRFAGVIGTRADALLSAPARFSAANDSKPAQRALDALGISDDDPDGAWDEMVPESVLDELAVVMTVLNFGLAKIEWEAVDGLQWPRLTTMHGQFVRWDQTYRQYMFRSENMGEVALPRIDEIPHGDGNWLILTPRGWDNWRKASLRWMAPLLIYRRWDYTDWANYNEVYGKPIRVGYVPTGKNDAETQPFLDELAAMGANATMKVPRPATAQDGAGQGTGYGVELVEARSRGWDTFQAFKDGVDKDIAVGHLGVNLLTDAQGGSLALSQEQTPVFLKRVMKDAKAIAKAIRAQVLWHWAERNFGDGRLAPRVRFEVEQAESETEAGAGYKAIGDGLTALKAAGVPVDVRAIGEAHGIVMVSPEQEAKDQAEAAERAAEIASRFAPGGGGGSSAAADEGEDEDEEPAGDEGKKDKGDKKPRTAEMQARYIPIPPVTRYTFAGLPIAVENPKGSTRVWREDGDDGEIIGQTQMQADYGYIEGVMGSDKEELDVYVGPDEDATHVHVVHQLRAPAYKAHDEDKVMLGWKSADAALAAYVAHRNDGDRAVAGVSSIPVDRFKAKLQRRSPATTGKITAAGRAATKVAKKATMGATVDTCTDPRFELGDRVEALVDHMGGMKGKTGVVSLANAGSPPYYGITFDGEDDVHKWLAEDEIRPADGRDREPGPRAQMKMAAHAHAHDVETRAMALLERAEHMKLAAATPTAKRRAKLYGDQVADEAVTMSRSIVGDDLKLVLAAIDRAESPDALRAELRKAFASMDPAALTELVFRARMMARVGGKAAAVKRL